MNLHPCAFPEGQLLKECEVERLRRSGPGGQHRNKVETAIRITHHPTGIRAEASERRSQAENQREALRRLRMTLAVEIRSETIETPSELWQSRLNGTRIVVSDRHDDLPVLIAESLDVLASENWDAKASAEKLGTTTSQLVKLLKKESRAFDCLNQERTERGLARLT